MTSLDLSSKTDLSFPADAISRSSDGTLSPATFFFPSDTATAVKCRQSMYPVVDRSSLVDHVIERSKFGRCCPTARTTVTA